MNKLLLLLIVLSFTGCNKDDNTRDLLARSWQTTAVTVKTNGITSLEDLSSCTVNRIFTFRKDGTFSNEPSPSCTSPSPLPVFNGTWTLTDGKNFKALAQTANSDMIFAGEIIMLTKSKLVIRSIVDFFGGGRPGFPASEVTTEFSSR